MDVHLHKEIAESSMIMNNFRLQVEEWEIIYVLVIKYQMIVNNLESNVGIAL